MIVFLWIFFTGGLAFIGITFESKLVARIVEIAIELLQIGVFSTLIMLLIKISILSKIELETAWNILVPRYEEYNDIKKTYNKKSILTTDFLPDTDVSSDEFDVMKSRASKLFRYTIILYISIQFLVLMIGQGTVQTWLGNIISKYISSQLIFTIVGIPVVFANLVHNLRISTNLSPGIGLFLLEVGIPSIVFMLGLRNGISYHLYKRRLWVDQNSTDVLIDECVWVARICTKTLIITVLFLISLVIPYLLEFLLRGTTSVI